MRMHAVRIPVPRAEELRADVSELLPLIGDSLTLYEPVPVAPAKFRGEFTWVAPLRSIERLPSVGSDV